MDSSTITDILFAPDFLSAADRTGNCSVGIVIDGDRVFWGEYSGSSSPLLDESGEIPATTIVAELNKILKGQRLAELNWNALQLGLDAMNFAPAPSLRMGIEQAILAGLANNANVPAAENMAQIFANSGLPAKNHTRLIVEVENHQATPAIIESMIALKPDGLSYRLSAGAVVESIGQDAEYLQRFARELAILLTDQGLSTPQPPVLYLGLQGALGALTIDPRRDTGRLLGLCVGLENAASNFPLWLEDPFILDDEVAHMTTIRQLHEFMRVRGMPTQLIGRAHANSADGLRMLCDTDAIDGACLVVGEWGSLSALADGVETLRRADKIIVLAVNPLFGRSNLEFFLDFAEALGIGHVLVNVGWGGTVAANDARTHMERRSTWLNYTQNNS